MRFARIALMPLMAAALIAAACAPTTGGTASPAPKQELTLVQGADAETLDPQGSNTRITLNIIAQYAETLTKVAYTEKGEASVVPLLATSWTLLNDTTWQFKLRQGVKFHNGEPFDAEAVKYSIDRMNHPDYKSLAKKYAASVASVNIIDSSTVNIVTKTTYPLVALDFSVLSIVPPKYTAGAGNPQVQKPVGTGPFKFVEWVKDDHLTIEANPDYWGGRPKLDKITFKPVPEASTRSTAIQTGTADIVMSIAASSVATLKQGKGFHVDNWPSARVASIRLDQAKDPILKNVKVREALNLAVDKAAIVSGIYQGNGELVQGQNMNAAYVGFNPAIKAVPYDQARAKQLLTEAGYPNGFEMNLWTPRGSYASDYEVAQAVGGALDKIGVKVTVKPLEFAVYIADYAGKKLTPAMFTATATPPDADSMYEHFKIGGTYSYANVPELDALIAQERATLDPAKRLPILQKMAQVDHDNYLSIWLNTLPNLTAASDRVQGFRAFPNEGYELYGVSLK